MDKISVVIPVYRAVESLEKLVVAIKAELGESLAEMVLVYDCGNPESWAKIEELSAEHSFVKGVHLSRNFGQHNATICGFEYTTGAYVLTMDEDLQHDPQELPKLIAHIKSGDYDLVYGKYEQRKHTGFRNITSRTLSKLLLIGIPELNPDYTSFRVLKSDVAKSTIGMSNSYTFLDGYLTWITANTSSVGIAHRESEAGKSAYSVRKLIEHSVNIFVTFSNLPIRVLTYFAVIFFLFSSVYSFYIIGNVLMDKNYLAGFPTMIVLIGFGFGFTLLGLGVLGEYIQRINLKTTNRPNYKVRQTTGNDLRQTSVD